MSLSLAVILSLVCQSAGIRGASQAVNSPRIKACVNKIQACINAGEQTEARIKTCVAQRND